MNTDPTAGQGKTQDRYAMLLDELGRYGSIAVAFSGGVDSSFLAAAAARVAGLDILLLTAQTLFQAEQDIEWAGHMASTLGLPHRVIKIDLSVRQDILSNPEDRCYWCKDLLFSRIKEEALEDGVSTLVHGANLDDFHDYRPGMKAADAIGFLAPLAECGMTKKAIREYSGIMGLETWDMPSGSCLAARIPYGETITPEKLSKIDRAERIIFDMGFETVRVRLKGNDARIELDPADIERFAEKSIRKIVSRKLKNLGLGHISLDLKGYRSGSMNEI
ncbi:MAG: ATP-dependent sacrificial sulfur transferase LarE [Desulfobacteraceae bacterium]